MLVHTEFAEVSGIRFNLEHPGNHRQAPSILAGFNFVYVLDYNALEAGR